LALYSQGIEMSLLDILYSILPSLKPPPEEPAYREYNATLHTYLQHWPTMTAREIEVARLIYFGYSNEAIAQELNISVSTVKTHVHNLLIKFNVRSRWILRDILASMGGFE
jgi:DNA-binding NarL/FixJ family response regulator